MARDVIIHQINDWSVLNSKDDVWNKIDLSTLEINFGIHKFQGRLWSSGYVGVGRLHDKNGRYLQSAGKEHIVVVTSQYGMEPWNMIYLMTWMKCHSKKEVELIDKDVY